MVEFHILDYRKKYVALKALGHMGYKIRKDVYGGA